MGRVRKTLFSLALLSIQVGLANAGNTESLLSALDRQDAWLSQSSEAANWQAFLRTDQLREALAAPSVDRRMLASVLGRYESQAAGLQAPAFTATRNALTNLANELGVPMALRWSEQAHAAKSTVTPFDKAALRDARYEAVDAMRDLDRYLVEGDPATRKGWQAFLQWKDLDEQLQAETPDWQKLDGVVAKFYNGYPGLEFPKFVRVREALRKYTFVGKLSESGDSRKSLSQYLTALGDVLAKYNDNPTTKNAADAAAIADWLYQINRDQDLAAQLRAAHSQPNIRLRIAESFIARRFAQPVNETTNVNEMLLETHVSGKAITNGHITTDIVANPSAAQIDILFNGVTTANTIGRQKPVTIRSTSWTNLSARKPLYLYPTQIQSGSAHASGSTRTQIQNITPDNRLGRKLVEKIAWKRAGEQKPKTERIAAGRAARRLETKLDAETEQLLSDARRQLAEQWQGPINRRGLIPETIRTSSSDSHVLVAATQAGRGQLAAMSYPPTFSYGNEVVAQIHESALNNTAEKAIAGLTLTDERIAELVQETTGDVPEELRIQEDSQPWSISFDWKQPVTVEFSAETMRISVRGRRFTSGERVLNKVMEMSATYRMQSVPGKGVILTREGEVDVAFPGNKSDARLRASDRVFKTLMQRKFSELFKPEIEGDGFTLPGKFQNLGRIRLNNLSAEDGWLSLGWK